LHKFVGFAIGPHASYHYLQQEAQTSVSTSVVWKNLSA
jgi:hypothetical protein